MSAIEAAPGCERVQDFEDFGIASSAEGVVVQTGGGDEFRISVVQTRYAPGNTLARLTPRAG
jgi:hypothetical protein